MNDTPCNQKPKKTITVDLWKAMLIFITALIASAGGGVWATLGVINNDHFAIASNTEDIQKIDKNYCIFMESITKDITDIKVDIATIKGSLLIK